MGLKAKNKVWWNPQILLFISCICFSGFVFSNEVPEEVSSLLALKSGLVDSLGKIGTINIDSMVCMCLLVHGLELHVTMILGWWDWIC